MRGSDLRRNLKLFPGQSFRKKKQGFVFLKRLSREKC